jgi:hypothetical protein
MINISVNSQWLLLLVHDLQYMHRESECSYIVQLHSQRSSVMFIYPILPPKHLSVLTFCCRVSQLSTFVCAYASKHKAKINAYNMRYRLLIPSPAMYNEMEELMKLLSLKSLFDEYVKALFEWTVKHCLRSQ